MKLLWEVVKEFFNNTGKKEKIKLVFQKAEKVEEIIPLLNNPDLDAVIHDRSTVQFGTTFLFFNSPEKLEEFSAGLGIRPFRTLWEGGYCAKVNESSDNFIAGLQNSGYFDIEMK